MRCPRCRVDMAESRYEEVALDVCPQCRGLWLDDGELAAICERRDVSFTREARDAAWADIQQKRTSGDLAGSAPQLRCPTCLRQMSRLQHDQSSTILVDRCPDCGGIFLDDSEIEKLQMWTEEQDARRREAPAVKPRGRASAALSALADVLFTKSHRSKWSVR